MKARLGLRGHFLPVGWQIPANLSEDEWLQAGIFLGKLERSVAWMIGDWWLYGNRMYGSRKALVDHPDWEGPSFQTCMNAASVCRSFDTSRRREVLSFTHHSEVAGLEPNEADRLLDWAEKTDASVKDLRIKVNQWRPRIGSLPSSETCSVKDLTILARKGSKFGCIYADPPWQFENQATRASTDEHYDPMTLEELCSLPVRALSADDAHIHIWTTSAHLPEALKLIGEWGFTYKSQYIWVKSGKMGLGNYWRSTHETLLTGVREKAPRFNDSSLKSWGEFDRREHSRKPDEVRHMIERASPGPRLELFARLPQRAWTTWGNQIDRKAFLDPRS